MKTPPQWLRLTLALLFCVSVAVGWQAAENASAQAPLQWSCEQRPWLAGVRVAQWGGDTGGLGSALPDGYVATVGSDTANRRFNVFLFDGDDTTFSIRYDDLQLEPGTSLPTGRFDPQNLPVVTYHDGMLKIWIKQWQGGLFRIYTWCRLR